MDILFREKASSKVLTETLNKMDKCIYLYKGITPSPNEKLLSHFAGQLYLGCATLLVKRFQEEKELWKDGIKHAWLLFLWAYGADISSQCWNEGGARRVIAGHMLQSLGGETNQFDDELSSEVDLQSGEKLFKAVFVDQEYQNNNSYLAQQSAPAAASSHNFPSNTDIASHCQEYVTWYSSDLHMLVWLLYRYYSHGKILDLPFQLPWTETVIESDDLNFLDLDSFLYCVVYSVGWDLDQQFQWEGQIIDITNVLLPPCLSAASTTGLQNEWWSMARRAMSGELQTADSPILQQGVETIRCSGLHGLEINLTMKLAETFASTSSVASCSPGVSALFIDRAILYHKATITNIKRIENFEFMLMETSRPLFQAAGDIPDQVELTAIKEAANDYISLQNITRRSQRRHEDILGGLDNEVIAEVDNEGEDGAQYNLLARSDYHTWLLSQVLDMGDTFCGSMCYLHGRCGRKVQIPFFILQNLWPIVGKTASQFSCGHETLEIFLPDTGYDALLLLRDLVTTGSSVNELNNADTVIQDLKSAYFIDFNVAKVGHDGLENIDNESTFQNAVENVMFNEQKTPNKSSVPAGFSLGSLCSKFCTNNCHNKLRSWSVEDINKLNEKFSSNRIIDKKSKLLNHLKAQREFGLSESGFIVNQHEFCVKYFAYMTGVSEYIVGIVLRDFNSGIELYEHGNTGCVQHESPATTRAICWIKAFSEAFGQFSPEENVTVLSYWLTKMSLFNMFIEETPGPHISQSLFYSIFKTKFGHNRIDKTLPFLRISKYSTHSVCSVCVALNMNQKQCKNEDELKQAKSLRNNHRINFGAARREVEEIKQSALRFPSDNLFVQIDGMDNSKSYLPRYLELSKDQAQKERLPSKISGCNIYSGWYEHKRKVLFYLNHDIFEQGSNLVITLVHMLLQEFVKDWKKLPRKLHLNLGTQSLLKTCKLPIPILSLPPSHFKHMDGFFSF